LMVVIWRSVSAAVLCMIPNIAPVLIIFMTMGALGIWLDVATAMIATMAVGIAVDDTIHVYHGYSKRVARGVNPVWALARTYHHAGSAIMATTIVLCTQYLLLTLSDFVPTSRFGFLSAVGIFAALIFDLLVLPALLVLIGRKRRQRTSATG